MLKWEQGTKSQRGQGTREGNGGGANGSLSDFSIQPGIHSREQNFSFEIFACMQTIKNSLNSDYTICSTYVALSTIQCTVH